ncbi:hypothetical protein [uncultured Roseobacter sp.]|nr:hypothetical protein [uncultured Roseobacter sp.]
MVFRNWIVIGILAVVGLALISYWISLPDVPDGVTPQSGMDDTVKAVAALAGAITTLGGAVFGVLGKLNEYRLAKLEIEEKRMALEERKPKNEDG